MYCTQCTSRQVLLMCTQRLGWGFVRPGRTHTHGCLRSHATYLPPHAGMLCLGCGPHASVVICRAKSRVWESIPNVARTRARESSECNGCSTVTIVTTISRLVEQAELL